MVSVFLRWELCARLSGDEIPKRRLPSLEFAGLVMGRDPIGNFRVIASLQVLSQPNCNRNRKDDREEVSSAYR
jgi:hypothetical protein